MFRETSCTIVSTPSGLATCLVRFSALRTLSRIIGAWALGIGFWLIALPSAAASGQTILVFGDSLSAAYGLRPEQGWVALLDKRLRDEGYKYEVVNASISGETTSGGLQRLPRALQLHTPRILILELGANDALRGLPIATARDNLARMIEMAQRAGAATLLVGMRMPPNYGPRYTGEFVRMYADLKTRYRVTLVPFLLEAVALDPARMQQDGLHPTADAEPAVLDTLWSQLKSLLKKDR
ncbi:MAG: arylesterase [Sinobacteraceae bacterium]|nr:arylesterase [Nevskiaceae bacterium]